MFRVDFLFQNLFELHSEYAFHLSLWGPLVAVITSFHAYYFGRKIHFLKSIDYFSLCLNRSAGVAFSKDKYAVNLLWKKQIWIFESLR